MAPFTRVSVWFSHTLKCFRDTSDSLQKTFPTSVEFLLKCFAQVLVYNDFERQATF